MQEQKRISDCVHEFEVVTRSGAFGEITVRKPLSDVQVNVFKQDPAEAQKLCPHGAIQCAKCAAPLLQATVSEVSKPRFADPVTLLRSLRRQS